MPESIPLTVGDILFYLFRFAMFVLEWTLAPIRLTKWVAREAAQNMQAAMRGLD